MANLRDKIGDKQITAALIKEDLKRRLTENAPKVSPKKEKK